MKSTVLPLTDPIATAFAPDQTNRAMATTHEYEIAARLLERADLKAQANRPKSWDQLIGIHHAGRATGQEEPIPDAGADLQSPWANGAAEIGFKDVLGMNLSIKESAQYFGIRYGQGDITGNGVCL